MTIGIDISINSTGISIIDDSNNISHYLFTCLPSKVQGVDISTFNYNYKDIKDYSLKEIQKIKDYNMLCDIILNKIGCYINTDTIINIEGYSMSSQSSSLLDIVTLSTIIRCSLMRYNCLINIISPTSNKKKTGSGKATKKDVLIYLLSNYNSSFLTWVDNNKTKILKPKLLWNGVSDISDSMLLCL